MKKKQNKNMKVEKHLIKDKKTIKIIKELCFKSKNLYNLANYYLRQCYILCNKSELTYEQKQFIDFINQRIDEYNDKRYQLYLKKKEEGKLKKNDNEEEKEFKILKHVSKKNSVLNWQFLEWAIREDKLNAIDNPYKELPAATSKQIMMDINEMWKSYTEKLKNWFKDPSKYTGKPNMPNYKDKNKGEFTVIFTGQQVKNEKGIIHFPNNIPIKIKTKVTQKINEVRIVPHGHSYVIEVVYTDGEYPEERKGNRSIGIDLGVNNLCAITNNVGLKPILINGRPIKSINQYYNKLKAKYMSYVGGRGTSNRLKRLELKRKNLIEDKFHKISRHIVNYCVEHDIDQIVIGYNKTWKQSPTMGKKNNQQFVYIPFKNLINKIKYKAKQHGIKVIEIQEAYTSKCDALGLEEIGKHEEYIGERKGRLFKSHNGRVINADINGSLNILRKVIGDDFIKEMIKNKYKYTPIKVTIN
jgi:putative transposase